MYKKILILSPAGANANYIMLVLQKRKISHELSYHNQGTHHRGGETFKNSLKHFTAWNDSLEKLNNNSEWFSLHNIVDQKFYFVIINWWEKLYYNADGSKVSSYPKNWIEEQTKIWKKFSYPIIRAHLNWFYGYKNKNRQEFVDYPQIKNK